MNASTGLSMNGKSPVTSTAPPFVLRFSKDERWVFQQNHNHYNPCFLQSEIFFFTPKIPRNLNVPFAGVIQPIFIFELSPFLFHNTGRVREQLTYSTLSDSLY